MVRKSLNTHGTLSVYLLCRLLTVNCFQKNRFGEIVNSGSQSNSKVQSTLRHKRRICFFKIRYDWGQTPWYFYQKHCRSSLKPGRVPMVWAWRSSDHPIRIPHDAHYILGFNEPNFKAQANMTPQKAAAAWRELERESHGKPLVSPAAAPCGGSICVNGLNAPEWFDQFFQVNIITTLSLSVDFLYFQSLISAMPSVYISA